MNDKVFRYIIAVAEEGSFTRAAKKLYIAQPSLSQIIKNQEDMLGVTIFDRRKNPVVPTDAGNEYLRWARQMVSIQENMKLRLRDYSVQGISNLKIGILPECSAFILPKPLKTFREANPNICVQVCELSSNDLQNYLERSETDFIIGLTHPDTFKYCNLPLYDEKIVLATPENFISNDIKDVDLAQFADAPFVMMETGQFLYNITHDLCKSRGFVPKTIVECYNLETAMHMVKAGVGITLIPDLMACLVEGLNYYGIQGSTPESQISVVYSRERHLTEKAGELIQLIELEAKNKKNSTCP